MQNLQLSLTPEQYHTEALLRQAVSSKLGVGTDGIAHIEVIRRSLDSRRGIHYLTQVEVYLQGETYSAPDYHSQYKDCHNSEPVVIVGAGPAGLFAALHALELGIKPIVVERGFPVEQRRADITQMVRSGRVNPDSNWCFGEGGAGTYSDGKLYTRSTKRGNVGDVMKKFVEHGADPSITIDAHAHIGTDRLPSIIGAMRETIIQHGGEFCFGHRVEDLIQKEGRVCGVRCSGGDTVEGIAVLLATGHSARDIYHLFHRRGWMLEAKPFAMGVRVEHPQKLIDDIQYHGSNHSPFLPPASYSLTTQVEGHGVFSFCMCPGGVIVPAATADGQQVVNGMSNASRSSRYANSGIAVTVSPDDVKGYEKEGVLSLLKFQQDVEEKVAAATGGGLIAPASRLTDFCTGRMSQSIERTNYMGEVAMLPVHELLPAFVTRCLQKAFPIFGQKMRGFYTNQATILAVESRTSSPVRIPRDEKGEHPQLKGLFPCGEGAGYAGGIVSSAIDGINAIDKIVTRENKPTFQ